MRIGNHLLFIAVNGDTSITTDAMRNDLLAMREKIDHLLAACETKSVLCFGSLKSTQQSSDVANGEHDEESAIVSTKKTASNSHPPKSATSDSDKALAAKEFDPLAPAKAANLNTSSDQPPSVYGMGIPPMPTQGRTPSSFSISFQACVVTRAPVLSRTSTTTRRRRRSRRRSTK